MTDNKLRDSTPSADEHSPLRIEAHPNDPAEVMFHWADETGNRMLPVIDGSNTIPPPSPDVIQFWTITKSVPGDPNPFVARRLDFNLATKQQVMTGDVRVGRTLFEVRRQLPPGLTNLGRQPEDLPQIVETWI
jgi:hypothetical protein